MADKIIDAHIKAENIRDDGCRQLVEKLQYLAGNPKDGIFDIEQINSNSNRLFSRSKQYYCGCREFKDFIEKQNESDSQIKFKVDNTHLRDDKVDYVSTKVNTKDRMIQYTIGRSIYPEDI